MAKRGRKPKNIAKIDNQTAGEDKNLPEVIEIKTEFTAKELAFIRLHFSEGLNQIDAVRSAGYKASEDRYASSIAKRIIEKYESQADDHRKIFRELGAGETAVIQGLLNLAQKAKSEMVRLNAWTMIAKCLGLTKEAVEQMQGIQIVIKGGDGQAIQVQAEELKAGLQASPQAALPALGQPKMRMIK